MVIHKREARTSERLEYGFPMSSRIVAGFISALVVFAFPKIAFAQPQAPLCGNAVFDRTQARLRAIEHDTDGSMTAVATRSTALAGIASGLSALATSADRCDANARTRADRIARIDTLIVWSRMLALRAVDAPVYPKPYRTACHAYDVSALQLAFIDAWIARTDARGSSLSRNVVWTALGREPSFGHVASLASAIARHIGVRDLPTLDSDEDRWQTANRARHARLAAQLEPGASCGPKLALWGMPAVENARGDVETAAAAPDGATRP
jgi:hypothetical protein